MNSRDNKNKAKVKFSKYCYISLLSMKEKIYNL